MSLISTRLFSRLPEFNRRRLLKGLFAATAVSLVPFAAITQTAEAASPMAIAAIKEALRGNFNDAGEFASRSGDEAAVKLVELLYLKDHGKNVGFQRIRDFQTAAPKWPLSDTLKKRAEQSLFQDVQAPEIVISYFDKGETLTAEGHAVWLADLRPAALECARASGFADRLEKDGRLFFNAREVIRHYQENYTSNTLPVSGVNGALVGSAH